MCTVHTKSGKLQGKQKGNIKRWAGVPYAEPPTGDLRFRESVPVRSWLGIRDASRFGSASMQKPSSRAMSEDCLYLNIWSPAEPKKDRAVMFFIHGGSFVHGAGSDSEFDGETLAVEGDVVVVTINYRLGVFGFMDFSHIDGSYAVNCGFSDILLALQWTYDNIEDFGGNPDNITVFGQSAGAYCACVLSVMPQARPYISKVIMMSGAPTLLHGGEEAHTIADSFLEYARIDRGQGIRKYPADWLIRKQGSFTKNSGLGAATFSLAVDGHMIEQFPIPMAAEGAGSDIPILIGTTREEMSFLFIERLSHALEIGGVFAAGAGGESEEVMRTIAEAYEKHGERGKKMLMSDLVFRMGSVWFGEAYSMHAPTWMYRFDYETLAARITRLHAFHSTDIPFVFGTYSAGITRPIFWLSPVKKWIREISLEIRKDFTDFAKEGVLSWETCKGEHTPGKCYDRHSSIEQVIDPAIKRAYHASEFKRRSFAGESNNLAVG